MEVMIEAADLIEQHPELRLRLIPTREIHTHNRSRQIDSPGAYEWWEAQAFDGEGSGLICAFHFGDPLDPSYRHHVRRFRDGRLIDPGLLRRQGYPSVRVVVLQRGRCVARAYTAFPAGLFVESGPGQPWSISIGPNRLATADEGWTVNLDIEPVRIGLSAFLRPGALRGGRLRANLELRPAFHTTTLSRAALPDSPSKAEHDWLIACPSGLMSGSIAVSLPRQRSTTVDLCDAPAALEHFWGNGPIGEGIRRWHSARLSLPNTAAFGELTIIRKFIQVAPTLMRFEPDALPVILRCDRGPRPVFQRSAWLLGYPLEMVWLNQATATLLSHRVERLNDASSCHATSISQARFEREGPGGEMIVSQAPGVVRLLQPSRVDSLLWRRWGRPVAAST